MAEDLDGRKLERKANGDGILIFVRLYPHYLGFSYADSSIIECFILTYCPIVDLNVDSARHLQTSATLPQAGPNQFTCPGPSLFPHTPVLSTLLHVSQFLFVAGLTVILR